jgi:hypothetical protein
VRGERFASKQWRALPGDGLGNNRAIVPQLSASLDFHEVEMPRMYWVRSKTLWSGCFFWLMIPFISASDTIGFARLTREFSVHSSPLACPAK